MCALYSVTTNQQAIRQLTLALEDTTGNLPRLPAIFTESQVMILFQNFFSCRTAGNTKRQRATLKYVRSTSPLSPNINQMPIF
jgi:hypothetical protein